MKFKTLKNKIIVYFIGLFTIFLLIFSIAFYYYFNQDENNQLKNELSNQAFMIEEKLENNEIIQDKNVKILKNKILKNHFTVKDLGENLRVSLSLHIKKPFDGTIIVTKIVDDKSENVVDTMLVIEPILLLFLILVTIKIVDKLLKPIEQITQLSKTISINNFNKTIPNNYEEKEIKELINSFNEMILRLQDGVENLDRFNNDVSHELRTPITVIKGEISVCLKQLREPKTYINSMNVISEEIEEMTKIIDNLLLLTKFTKDNISQTFEKCYLDMILLQALEKYEDTKKEIILDIENIEYYGNAQLLYHLFANLIDNAIKYSNSKINIKLYKKDKIYFEVIDDGYGIEASELKKITKRFYRVDKSRTKNIKGFGLGLSIVQKVVELHNGKLNIYSKIGEGTRVLVSV